MFCGRHLLAALLRPSNIDASAGAVAEVARIVDRIRAAWPRVEILLRADSGFARDELMAWCEANRVDYVFGLARNPRLVAELDADLAAAAAEHAATGQPARRFKEFSYATLDSWSRARRVIGKAEHLAKGPNPRFIVTSLPPSVIDGRILYERVYCARGEMENRIKEQQLDLFADRTSAATMRAQSAAAVVRVVRLRAARGLAPHRVAPHPVPGRHLWHDPPEAAQARREGHGLGAPDQGGDRLGLPVPHRVRARPSRLATWTGPPRARAAAERLVSPDPPTRRCPRRAQPRPQAPPNFKRARAYGLVLARTQSSASATPPPTRAAGNSPRTALGYLIG